MRLSHVRALAVLFATFACASEYKLPDTAEAKQFFASHLEEFEALSAFGRSHPDLEWIGVADGIVSFGRPLELFKPFPEDQSTQVLALLEAADVYSVSLSEAGGVTIEIGVRDIGPRRYQWDYMRLPIAPSEDRMCDPEVLKVENSWCVEWLNANWWIRYFWASTQPPSAA